MSAGPPAFDPYRDWLRIAAPERPVDFYTLLGLPRFSNDVNQITAAADQRLAAIFALVNGPYGAYAQPLFNELANAKATLLQPMAKQTYDAELWRRTSAPTGALPQAPAAMLPPTAPPVAPPVISRAAPTKSAPEQPPDKSPWFLQMRVFVAAAILLVAILAGGGYLAVRGFLTSPDPPANPDLAAIAGAADETPDDAPPEKPPEKKADVVVKQEGSGEVNFTAGVARIRGKAELQVVGAETVVGGWTDVTTQLEWEFSLAKPDVFQVQLIYANEDDWAEAKVTVEIAGERRSFETRASGGIDKFVTDSKFVPIKKGGKHKLTLFATEKPGPEVMILKAVRLVPTKQSAPDKP